ncbi:hypothetical protein CW670_11810 [Macrococcoides caseolyticum]|nr:hypothetical protein CW670_11810 [Macrococcus caseolyticus]
MQTSDEYQVLLIYMQTSFSLKKWANMLFDRYSSYGGFHGIISAKGVVLMKVSNDARIAIVYFEDEQGNGQRLVFNGTANDLRKEQEQEFDGLDLGDRFYIEDEKVRVFLQQVSFSDNDEPETVYYFVGPAELDSHKINSHNLKFEKFL